jgi:hypothetical protein
MRSLGWNIKTDFTALEMATIAVSVLALLVSTASFVSSSSTNSDVAASDAIKSEYVVFFDLAKLQLERPLTGHLFALTKEAYVLASSKVKEATSKVGSAERTAAVLQEQAVANYIFTAYELTYFQWVHARDYRDTERATFFAQDLQSFDDLMCNARLQWYWDPDDGMRMALGFATVLQDHVQTQVKRGCSMTADPTGPI